ncbi:hypothetical protein MASR2M74_16430 [Paracoccaceae bacterium]
MKKISAILALLFAGTAATAGGINEPIGEQKPVVVTGKTSSSNGGLIVLALLLLAGAAIAGGGSDGTTETPEG